MSFDDPTPWPQIHPGDHILLRSRAGTTHAVVTVARILPAEPGDGPGLTDTQGHSYRHYYFTADHTHTAHEISDSLDALAAMLEKIRTQLLERSSEEVGDDRYH